MVVLKTYYHSMKLIMNFKDVIKNILFLIIWTAISATAAFAAYFCFSFFVMMGYSNLPSALNKADCIIVPGMISGNDLLNARCEEAATLYHQGYSENIIVSGCYDEDIGMTEAESASDMLISLGVPKDNVFLEQKAINTLENFIFVKKIMDANGFTSSIIVSNDFHLLRCLSVAHALNYSDICAVSTPTDKDVLWYFRLRECRAIMFYALHQRF